MAGCTLEGVLCGSQCPQGPLPNNTWEVYVYDGPIEIGFPGATNVTFSRASTKLALNREGAAVLKKFKASTLKQPHTERLVQLGLYSPGTQQQWAYLTYAGLMDVWPLSVLSLGVISPQTSSNDFIVQSPYCPTKASSSSTFKGRL